jgi:hypothetical protein
VLLFKAAPELADLARSLQPDQIATLERKFAANNAEFRKKNMRGDREAQQKFRYQKSMEQFELWFGNFTREQEAQIRKASDARPLDNEIWLDERQRRQKMILARCAGCSRKSSARTPPWQLHADQGQLRAHGAAPNARPSSTPRGSQCAAGPDRDPASHAGPESPRAQAHAGLDRRLQAWRPSQVSPLWYDSPLNQ